MRTPLLAIIVLGLAAGCSGPPSPVCGGGLAPTVVTGLNGLLDGVPVVEVQLRVPETCAVLDTTWMFWDDEATTVRLGDAPTQGTLERGGVTVGDEVIFFRDSNVGVRLEYPEAELGPELGLVWFTAGEDLVVVQCSGSEATLSCAVRGS